MGNNIISLRERWPYYIPANSQARCGKDLMWVKEKVVSKMASTITRALVYLMLIKYCAERESKNSAEGVGRGEMLATN